MGWGAGFLESGWNGSQWRSNQGQGGIQWWDFRLICYQWRWDRKEGVARRWTDKWPQTFSSCDLCFWFLLFTLYNNKSKIAKRLQTVKKSRGKATTSHCFAHLPWLWTEGGQGWGARCGLGQGEGERAGPGESAEHLGTVTTAFSSLQTVEILDFTGMEWNMEEEKEWVTFYFLTV